MKQCSFIIFFWLLIVAALAQPVKKVSSKEKVPTQAEINKMMEDEMKGMSDEDKAQMRKVMKGVMPNLMEQNVKIADYPEFTSNKELVPKRDAAKIAVSNKKLSQAEMAGYAGSLYSKIIAKGDAAEIAIVKRVVAQTTKAN